MRDDDGEFKLVVHRKRRVAAGRAKCQSNVSLFVNNDMVDNSNINYETLFGKILEAEVELKNSLFADNLLRYLEDSLVALNVEGISSILCYGLGSFSNRRCSKYQLALLLSLKKQYNSEVYIYDPVFSLEEVEFLKGLGCNVIDINEEGKHVISDIVTLVYMPHCSIHLINNFLYANWCKKLNNCILLTNSFSTVADNSRKTNKSTLVDYILRIQPYVTEFTLRNDFLYEEVFNDLNIHIFLKQHMDKIPQSFWNKRDEPCYRNSDTDYLTAVQTEQLNVQNYRDKNES